MLTLPAYMNLPLCNGELLVEFLPVLVMLPAPSIACRVIRPFMDPIPADVGRMLVVWPGHPTKTLSVLTPCGRHIIRSAPLSDGLLYGALLELYLDGKIACLSLASERALFRSA